MQMTRRSMLAGLSLGFLSIIPIPKFLRPKKKLPKVSLPMVVFILWGDNGREFLAANQITQINDKFCLAELTLGRSLAWVGYRVIYPPLYFDGTVYDRNCVSYKRVHPSDTLTVKLPIKENDLFPNHSDNIYDADMCKELMY